MDINYGLTDEQVQERINQGKVNEITDSSSKTEKEIVRDNVLTYFNFIFLILSILLIIADSFRNLTFLPVIIANTVIGIFQEIRAKRTLDKVQMLHAVKTKVIRNGCENMVNVSELVLDDIIILEAGNQIPADAVVVEGNIQVNESLITGESDEIAKQNGDEILSGSFVVSGKCIACLNKVGKESYIAGLSAQAKKMDNKEQSEMIRSLDKILKVVGIVIIPLGILLFAQAFWLQNEGFQNSIISMVAAVIGMIPEGLYLLTTLTLTLSAVRLAQKRVLLHDMKCIETLSRVDVLCVDKTGTITENEMQVTKVAAISKVSSSDSTAKLTSSTIESYDSTTELQSSMIDSSDSTTQISENIMNQINAFVTAMQPDNQTMKALKKYFNNGINKTILNIKGFSSVTKYSCVEFEDGIYILGAPEMVLRDDFEKYNGQIEQYSSKGMRVLVFGKVNGSFPNDKILGMVEPLAFIMLENPIRENAKKTFEYFAKQGVEVKVISGDNPGTVSAIACEAGINNAENYVDMSKVESYEIGKAVRNNTVFGRVTPEYKRKLVQELQKSGKTVAMTGDGVNDILALKEADCSVAMASGSDAAAQVAQMVLLESDFSKMPEIVLEGRRVVNNIQRSAILFITKNIFSFILALISLILAFTYPFEPNQIALISTFTIGIPGFLLAQETNKNKIEGGFISNVIIKAMPAALTDVIAVTSIIIFGQVFEINFLDISTAATILLAIVGFLILYKITEPMNLYRIIVIEGCIITCLLCAYFFDELFAMHSMSMQCVMLCAVFAIATESVFRYLSLAGEKIHLYYNKKINNKQINKINKQNKQTK